MKRIFFSAAALLALAPGVRAEPSGKPGRIVSIMPSNTEILFALGAGDSVIGVTEFCNFPEEAEEREKVGSFIHPNIEKIVSLHPDLVLAGKWETSNAAPRLRKVGLRVEEIALPSDLEGIFGSILKIGGLIGRKKEAERLAADLKSRVENIRAAARPEPEKPTIYIEVDPPNWTVASKSSINDAVSVLGLKNIFGDIQASAAQVSWESVLDRDPDVILLFRPTRDDILKRPGAEKLRAVKLGRVIADVGQDKLNRPSPRIVEGMEELAARLKELGFR
ncbi:MAG: hypothetical protein A2902_05550 [Elusimicrobia bacterium RIFCSPLOWO2_01_FULL_64_13]|nr:MAG: hypothetical protein A2902_05550 [Elusimicrobia bacterium RIFCSPLOWO2_01_FULL_64_13]